MADLDLEKQLEKMRRDWDERARENARHYVVTGQREWSDDEFFRSGELTVKEEILTDMINICQGKEPNQMRVLEIGCGAGRITRALSGLFGEVHAVDVSGEIFGDGLEVDAIRAADLDHDHWVIGSLSHWAIGSFNDPMAQ